MAFRRVSIGILACGLWTVALIAQTHKFNGPFEVLVSQPQTVYVSPSGTGVEILKLANGAVVYNGMQRPGMSYISYDKGKSWRKTVPAEGSTIGVLSDGTLIVMGYTKGVRQIGPGEFIYPRWVSHDNWKTWKGPLDSRVHIPGATGGTGDDRVAFNGPLFWNSILQMPDGRLLATMYGYFEGDEVPISGFKPVPGFYRYRSLLVESRNRGADWSLVSTIAYDPNLGQEGPCEPSLTRLPDGELFCIMRTGYTDSPMHTTRSHDGGKTWSRLVSTKLTGVDPTLLVLSNGLLACSYGVKEYHGNRRERRLMFSHDGGRRWTHNTVVYAGLGGAYPQMVEIEPGKLLYGFEAYGFEEPGQTATPKIFERATTITVRAADPTSGLTPFPLCGKQ